MGVLIKQNGKILRESKSGAYKVIEDFIHFEYPKSFVVRTVDSLEDIKTNPYFSVPNYNLDNIIMGYYISKHGSFPLKAGNESSGIKGTFFINDISIGYYPDDEGFLEKEGADGYFLDQVEVYTTESLSDIVAEYAKHRKCILAETERGFVNKPLTSEEFIEAIARDRNPK